MSFDHALSFEPLTPPDFCFEDALGDLDFDFQFNHLDSTSSQASELTYEASSPAESLPTPMSTPTRSPIRQHGPLLLPKIRSQDQEIHSPPMHTDARYGFAPAGRAHHRSQTNPESLSFAATDIFSTSPPSMSMLCSSLSVPSQNDHHRRATSVQLDDYTLSKYGFPTYRQMPTYVASPAHFAADLYAVQNPFPQRTPSPLGSAASFAQMAPILEDDVNTTTLLDYLTSPNPAPALVHHLNMHQRDTTSKHFWWDVRQVRPWKSFCMSSIASIPDLHALLTVPVFAEELPPPPRTSLTPQTEADLQSIYATFYATKLNAALQTAQGPRHIMMRSHAHACKPASSGSVSGEAAFSATYVDENRVIEGRGLGRVVGLVKSFDRWNTGMRTEGPHRRVQYLRGLAHLHGAMREHGCRYGYIMTEIELLVARNGGDDIPHFGYLEVTTIQLAAHAPPPPPPPASPELTPPLTIDLATLEQMQAVDTSPALASAHHDDTSSPPPTMTALLALWYLHMLARDDALPGQPGWKSGIGAPAEGTRRKCMPKDRWMPEPQLAEKREAKRARGWIWPDDPVGRKELGKRGVRYVGQGAGHAATAGSSSSDGPSSGPAPTSSSTKAQRPQAQAQAQAKTSASARARSKSRAPTPPKAPSSSSSSSTPLIMDGRKAAAAAAAKMFARQRAVSSVGAVAGSVGALF